MVLKKIHRQRRITERHYPIRKKNGICLVYFKSLIDYLSRDKLAFELQRYYILHRCLYIFDTHCNKIVTRMMICHKKGCMKQKNERI